MDIENQHTEFKETWRDGFMKTLAAFANTTGGKLIVGRNDKGEDIGIDNAEYLLENLPNKILQKLNIHPIVKHIQTNDKAIIEINILPYDTAISCNGKFYIRTGSTTQELADKELHNFLLKKGRISWESVCEEQANMSDINFSTIEKFKKLAKKRVPNIEKDDTLTILKKLKLIDKDGNIRRAALLLFGNEPQNYFFSAYFKIGKFLSPTDLVTDDVIEGNLFEQFDKVLEILRAKYIRLMVKGYKDWVRIEEFEYPEDVIREAVINALIHKDYLGSHIQMKVFEDKITLWNPGPLLSGISIDELKEPHGSVLRNELICNTFYKADLIEAWGRGTTFMVDECKKADLPEPEYREHFGGFEIALYKDKLNEEYLKKLGLNKRQINAIVYIKKNGKITNSEYKNLANVTDRTVLRDINELLGLKIIKKHGTTKGAYYSFNVEMSE